METARTLLLKTGFMTNPADDPEIEALIKAIEEDGLPFSIAMGDLLRSLYGLSQSLGNHRGLDRKSAKEEPIAK